ncbi:MAG TPA: polyphenol oxidase family protein [Acidimicrobiales bacterium]
MTGLHHEIRQAGGRVARVRFTTSADGDFAADGARPELDARRRRVADVPWTWLRQVHGADVVVVDAPGARAGERADAAVTVVPGAALAVQTADCAPVALVGASGGVGAVHAGWRGLEAGVIERAAAVLDDLGAGPLRAIVGPCIHPECYEFGERELERLAARYGSAVRGRTAGGRPALDLPATVGAALAGAGIEQVAGPGPCTACGELELHSHRARRDTARQAMVVWSEAA